MYKSQRFWCELTRDQLSGRVVMIFQTLCSWNWNVKFRPRKQALIHFKKNKTLSSGSAASPKRVFCSKLQPLKRMAVWTPAMIQGLVWLWQLNYMAISREELYYKSWDLGYLGYPTLKRNLIIILFFSRIWGYLCFRQTHVKPISHHFTYAHLSS